MFKFNSIEEAIEDIREGKIVVVIDDPDRENEGDLLMAAEKVTGEAINFMAKYGRGLICMPIEEKRAKELNIGPMVSNNTDNHETAFTVSIDHIETTTGISAFERALTIQKVLEDDKPENFRRPGHVFPLIAKEGGVLERIGHTEAAIDLPKLAGLKAAGVICEIMSEDGTMARTPELIEFAKYHNLKIITIADLVKYRKSKELKDTLVERVVEIKMPTRYGDFKMFGFINKLNGEHHVALVKEDNATWVSVKAEPELLKYIVYKGSIAIDGISLTVAYVDNEIFKVSIIPHTGEKTILLKKRCGDTVNLECDVIGKYVEKLLGLAKKEESKKTSISESFLRENGFL